MSYENKLVFKPWGFEHQVYQNDDIVIWFLTINEGQGTSLHCHPNKDTGLIALEGMGELEFISSSHEFVAPYKTMIRRGIFHRTKSLNGPIKLFEIETSNNRNDLIRLSDNYDREGEDYEEGREASVEKLDLEKEGVYNFCNRRLEVRVASSDNCEELFARNIIAFLTGGIFTEEGLRVLKPGDVISGNVLKKLSARFNIVPSKVMIVE